MNVSEKNKRLVLEAFDTLFNKRDYPAAEKFWSPHYIQHSAHIAPGREGLFNLIKSLPPTLKYEPGRVVAEGDFVIVHGRYSGARPTYFVSLLSGYKPNRISWLELSSNSDWESNASNTCKMGTFSRLVMLKICRIW